MVCLHRNVLDVTAYSAQVAITVCHLGRLGLASNALSVLMAIQVLILYVKLQYFARWGRRSPPACRQSSKAPTLTCNPAP